MSASPAKSARRSAFARELRHEIEIDAAPVAVWHILTATDEYSWNPFMHRVAGELAADETLEVEIEPQRGRHEIPKRRCWRSSRSGSCAG